MCVWNVWTDVKLLLLFFFCYLLVDSFRELFQQLQSFAGGQSHVCSWLPNEEGCIHDWYRSGTLDRRTCIFHFDVLSWRRAKPRTLHREFHWTCYLNLFRFLYGFRNLKDDPCLTMLVRTKHSELSFKSPQHYYTPVFLGEGLLSFARWYIPRPNSESLFEQVCSSCCVDKMTWAPREGMLRQRIRLWQRTLNLHFYS